MRGAMVAAVGARVVAVLAVVAGVLGGCAPWSPATGSVLVAATLTQCPGVMPPEGGNGCWTEPWALDLVAIRSGATAATFSTGADGSATVALPAGTYRIEPADVPPYLVCDETLVTVAAGSPASAAVHCSIHYP